MKSFLFRLSMSLGVLLMILSAIGRPAAVEAAPKPSNTPKPTKTSRPTNTPRPTQTPTATQTSISTATSTFTLTWTSTATLMPTLTFTPTFTEVPTDTPTATLTFTVTPSATPTAIPTGTLCAPLSAAISPSGGDKTSRTYTITGYDANGCAAPLQYHWQCSSDDFASCINFLDQMNVGTYGMPSGPLDIHDFTQYNLVLDICQIGTSNCSTAFTTYTGIPGFSSP